MAKKSRDIPHQPGPEEEIAAEPGKTIYEQVWTYVKTLGYFARLLAGLMIDSRVDTKVKVFAGVVLAYVASPVDFIPEIFQGLFGMLDDFVLSAFAIHVILNWVDPEIVKSHWHGASDLLETVQNTMKNAELLIPDAILKKIQVWIGKYSEKAAVVATAEPAPDSAGRSRRKRASSAK